MGITTNSTALEEPKETKNCNVFNLYKLIANKEETAELESKYKAGGFGYGDAKKTLLNKILEYFAEAREKHQELFPKQDFVLDVLNEGQKKAKVEAKKTLDQAKEKIGYI